MRICPICGKMLPDDVKFCDECVSCRSILDCLVFCFDELSECVFQALSSFVSVNNCLNFFDEVVADVFLA